MKTREEVEKREIHRTVGDIKQIVDHCLVHKKSWCPGVPCRRKRRLEAEVHEGASWCGIEIRRITSKPVWGPITTTSIPS